ncbi:MAG: AAA family ATPase [Thermoguttaceae bacterium]|nr:AAA family ATPase [Thermoguttaceae bacterium]
MLMYESYWQLNTRPFENGGDPAFYYPGESQQAALLKLRYAIENQRGGAILAGPPGSGKTLLVGMLRTMLPERFSPLVHLVFPQMPAEELLAWLAAEVCGTGAGAPTEPIHQTLRRVERSLAENTDRGCHAVVVIDEAHLIDDPGTLEALRLLLNFESQGRPGLTLLLVGQVKLLTTLDRMPQLEERLGVKCLLRPFSEIETAAYVEHRLRVAGAARPVFEPEALTALYHLTHGIARRINRLCDLALLIGFAEERQSISAAQLEAVSEELVAIAPE